MVTQLFLWEGNCMIFYNNQHSELKMVQLEDLRWQNRIILVFTDNNMDNLELYKNFQTQKVDIQARHIRYFLIGKHILSNGPETLDKQTLSELRNKYQPEVNNMLIILIGKDGDEKYRETKLDFEEIYRVIDTMPIRQQEIAHQKAKEKILIDFTNAEETGTWWIINDGVMGGLSQSEIRLTGEGTAIFQGNVSLENYGGFSSTRTNPRDFQLENYQGLLVRVKGDGKKYQLRLHTDNRFDGIAYRTYFQTQPSTWMTIRAPFKEFLPVFRGRIMNNVSLISPEKIEQVGFMISDKQDGSFKIEIDSIQAYK